MNRDFDKKVANYNRWGKNETNVNWSSFIIYLIFFFRKKLGRCSQLCKGKVKEHSEDLGDKEWLWFQAQAKQTKNAVFWIVKEVAEGHANGTAKRWAEGLFELVTILLETDLEGEEKIWVHSMKFTLSGKKQWL